MRTLIKAALPGAGRLRPWTVLAPRPFDPGRAQMPSQLIDQRTPVASIRRRLLFIGGRRAKQAVRP